MNPKETVLYISPSLSSFVRLDIELLNERYSVKVFQDRWADAKKVPWLFFKQFWQMLFSAPRSKALIVSFAGYWSFWPIFIGTFLGKSVYVILHGTDVCRFEEIQYGNLRIPAMRWFNQYAFKNASLLLPVSESLIETTNTYFFGDERPLKFGVQAEFPKIIPKYQVIPNGLDIEFWKTSQKLEKEERTFVTVATQKQHLRKGVDLILQVAESMQQARFVIIGSVAPQGEKIPKNVQFTGRLPQQELIDHFRKARFYLQLSAFEGFGLSICEAMLCECIPIGSDVNFLPEIIGETGYVLKHRSVKELDALLKEAMADDNRSMGTAAAKRIEENFPKNRRAKMLHELLAR